MVRGHPFGADFGDTYWLAGAEYRWPLWRIDRGFGALPAFVRAISGAVFVDAGNAAIAPRTAAEVVDGTLVGLGAELRATLFLGWTSPLSVRAGWAFGADPAGYAPNDLRSLYLLTGTSF
jgi:outer membrane protein assembly factor BamA